MSQDIRHFFVLGCQKTGTTLLARVLDQHSDIACLWESHVLRPRSNASILNTRFDNGRNHGFAASRLEAWAAIWFAPGIDYIIDRRQRTACFAATMPEIFDDFGTRCGASCVGDKWPWFIDHVGILLETFPQARFFYNVRDPRAVWNSGQRFLDREMGDVIIEEMLAKDAAMQALESDERFMTVRYEDVVQKPYEMFERLWGFLGRAFEPQSMLYDPARDPYPNRWDWVPEAADRLDVHLSRKWTHQVPPAKIRAIEKRCEDYMGRYGYEPWQPDREEA